MTDSFNINKKLVKPTSLSTMSKFVLTSNEELKNDPEYKLICQLMYGIIEGGLSTIGKGYCLTMSDIVHTLLFQAGIPCKIVECRVFVQNKKDSTSYWIGFDDLTTKFGNENTHVVVITNTKIPMLIDMSLGHVLPKNIQGIIDVAEKESHNVICNIDTDFVSLTYKEKNDSSLPIFYQRSILDRINTDNTIFRKLSLLQRFIIIIGFITAISMVRGFVDFYQVFVKNDNYWGPSAVKQIVERLEHLEKSQKFSK